MKFLFLEPFFDGSHRDFAEGFVAYSRHDIDLLTLPARFWKWRMRGAALYFAEKLNSVDQYQGIICSGLMSLSDLKTLLGSACPPCVVYFHESQLTYPLSPGESMDVHFGFTDITTALAADRILFNSKTHFDAFFDELPQFISMMPDYRPRWVIDAIKAKAGMIYPGCHFPKELNRAGLFDDIDDPPLIIWNHRWEFDKGPEEFFKAIDVLTAGGVDFRLALLGENFESVPEVFNSALERYGKRIIRYGYVESKDEYYQWLKRGTVVVSTATQENFGISIVEAIRHGCIPILPDRLSYPEIIPKEFRKAVLYDNHDDLVKKISQGLRRHKGSREMVINLAEEMGTYAWENVIRQYDEEMENLVRFL